jgi:hypothetical protein
MHLTNIVNGSYSSSQVIDFLDEMSLRPNGEKVLAWLMKRFDLEARRIIRQSASGESVRLEVDLMGLILPNLKRQVEMFHFRNEILLDIASYLA